jgi:hypothetical protein
MVVSLLILADEDVVVYEADELTFKDNQFKYRYFRHDT